MAIVGQQADFWLDQAVSTAVPSVAPDERIYAIGDIHGRFGLLVSLLAKICADAELRRDHRRTRFVFLGDYIDRGERSKDVLDMLTKMADMKSKDIVFLKGNHEEALQRFLTSPVRSTEWLEFGGLQTLASFGVRAPRPSRGLEDLYRVKTELAAAMSAYESLFDALRTSFRSGDVVFTHAGVDSTVSLEEQTSRTLLWGHPHAQQDDPMPGLRIVHGHYDSDMPVSTLGRICVDTGAYYSNRLTAVRLDDGEAFLSTEAT